MNSVEDLERKLDKLLKDPENAKLFNELGVLLYRMRDLNSAEMYFQKAWELNPTEEDILYNYALLLYLKSYWKKAVPVFQSYLELHPGDGEVIEKLGDALYQMGEYASAAKTYEQIRKGQKGETAAYGRKEKIKSVYDYQER